MSIFNEIGSKVNQSFNQVTSLTKDYSDKMKVESEIRNIEKSVDAYYCELGRMKYESDRNLIEYTQDFEPVMVKIDQLQAKLRELESNKEELQSKVVCPACGKTIQADMNFCIFCGASADRILSRSNNVCSKCGTAVNEGDTFCLNCGNSMIDTLDSFSEEPNIKKCAKCGEILEDHVAFCMHCGTPVPQAEELEDTLNDNEN